MAAFVLAVTALLAITGSDGAEGQEAQHPTRTRSDELHRLLVDYFDDKSQGERLGWGVFGPRFKTLVDANAGDDVAFEALFVTVTWETMDSPEFSAAMDLLIRHHAMKPQVGTLCRWLVSPAYFGTASEQAERLLREVMERNPQSEVRAEAVFSLALFLKNKAELLRQVLGREGGPLKLRLEKTWGPRYLDSLTRSNPETLSRESEKRFGLGLAAHRSYWETNLLPGQEAPKTVGEDLDRKPMRLSDFRGKVVLLSFWGFGCLPCRAMFPHEKALVKRFQGQPFVLLGVNGEADRANVRRLCGRDGITWRSWWDGGEEANRRAIDWKVRSWPAIFVIDHDGVIRYRDIHGDAIEVVVESLLAERRSQSDASLDGRAGR